MTVPCTNGVPECLDNHCLATYLNCAHTNFLPERCLDDKINAITETDHSNDNCIFHISLANSLKDMEENSHDTLYNKPSGPKNDNANNKMSIHVVCTIC